MSATGHIRNSERAFEIRFTLVSAQKNLTYKLELADKT